MNFTFIHAGDIHLDSPLTGLADYEGAPFDAIAAVTRSAFTRLVDDALARAVDLVVLPGDVFDGSVRDANAWLFFSAQLSRLAQSAIPVVMISGNHDAESLVVRDMSVPDGTYLLSSLAPETVVLEIDGGQVAVHGQSYPDKVVLNDLSATYPAPRTGAFNIGLLHTSAGVQSDHAPYAPCSVQALATHGYQYWALGHVHTFAQLHSTPPIVFSGVLQGRNIRETGPKGYVHVTVTDDIVSSVEHVPLPLVEWERVSVDCSEVGDSEDLRDVVHDALRSCIDSDRSTDAVLAIRLELTGTCPWHNHLSRRPDVATNEARRLAQELSANRIYVESVKVRTRPPIDTAALESDTGPLGEILRQAGAIEHDAQLAQTLTDAYDKLHARVPAHLSAQLEIQPGSALAHEVAGQIRAYVIPELAGTLDSEE